MKHVLSPSLGIVHFIHGRTDGAVCGAVVGFTSLFTDKPVNCIRCIRLIKEARKVKDEEMDEPETSNLKP